MRPKWPPKPLLTGSVTILKPVHSHPVATFYSTNGNEDECGGKWKQMDFPTLMQKVEQQAQISNSFMFDWHFN